MKNVVVFALIFTNVATGLLYLDGKAKLTEFEAGVIDATVTKTSNYERDTYGEECVKWLKEEGEKDGKREGEFYLGRSWKKYGQMVFEVIVPNDQVGRTTGNVLCTFDAQSGMMYSLEGANQVRWLFY